MLKKYLLCCLFAIIYAFQSTISFAEPSGPIVKDFQIGMTKEDGIKTVEKHCMTVDGVIDVNQEKRLCELQDKYNQFKKYMWFTWDDSNQINHIVLNATIFSNNDIQINSFIQSFGKHFKLIFRYGMNNDLNQYAYVSEDIAQGFRIIITSNNLGNLENIHIIKTEKISF